MTGSLEDDVRRRRLKAELFGVQEPPPKLGRYLVESTLGEGAMGVVYLARDERLDRTVALKVLRAEQPGGAGRLEREARALAKLAHPNVVAIHEVGDADGHTFIAMEHVRGPTLRAWMAEEHPLSERLEMVRQAARGLAAAHELHIVHRDFKPDNAIVGEDGRLRVVDFGLATSPAEAEALETTPIEIDADADPWARMTATGFCLGTPAYMAPELRAGEPPSPKGDQFALCVSAWEVLLGHHPLVGREDGTPAPTPKGTEVPARIVAALRTGLARDPSERHADLGALLEALEDRPPKSLGWLAAVAAVASIAAGVVAMRSSGLDASEDTAPAVAIEVTECALSFDDARRAMEDSLALAEQERVDATLTATQQAQARERHGAIRIALGQWDEGCAELAEVFDGFPGSRARCWHGRYCGSRDVLPGRTRCFAGDLEACRLEAIKHEYEWLEGKHGGADPMASAAASHHFGYLVELLSAGCEQGAADLCKTLASVRSRADTSR